MTLDSNDDSAPVLHSLHHEPVEHLASKFLAVSDRFAQLLAVHCGVLVAHLLQLGAQVVHLGGDVAGVGDQPIRANGAHLNERMGSSEIEANLIN
jgi:hypothetical protein